MILSAKEAEMFDHAITLLSKIDYTRAWDDYDRVKEAYDILLQLRKGKKKNTENEAKEATRKAFMEFLRKTAGGC